MTLTEYHAAVSEAFIAVDRICERTLLERSDLVLVMTPDVYTAMQYYDAQPLFNHEGARRVRPCYGYYRGIQIGIVNEYRPDTMITPAIVGTQYHNGMALDDIIVVGDDNRLFQMRDTNPVRFVDTGYTVSFDAAVMEQMSGRMENAAADALRDMFTITPAGITITMDDVQINEQLLAMLAGTDVSNPRRKKRKKACNTEDLAPGDTKALDEFINGFAIKQTLQQA